MGLICFWKKFFSKFFQVRFYMMKTDFCFLKFRTLARKGVLFSPAGLP